WMVPLIAILEGCNQIATVNRYRVLQAVCGNLVVWTCILLGFGLWVAVAIALVKVLWEAWLVGVRYGGFFQSFLRRPENETIDWRDEVWPLQWRQGVQVLFNYFGTALVVPVMFKYHDPLVAGRTGMTLTVIATLQAIALAWMQTRVPRFGMLISRGEYTEFDRIFRRLTIVSFSVLTAGGAAFLLGVAAVNLLGNDAFGTPTASAELVTKVAGRLAERLLSPAETAVFVLAALVLHLPQCQGLYIRAHKRDPLVWLTVLGNAAIGLGVWQWGGRFGPLGAGAAYLAVLTLWTLPGHTLLWRHCRRNWR
ncbi:MAG: hypothetical protein ACREIV_03150, partial [Planctomycetaceae bacterium]